MRNMIKFLIIVVFVVFGIIVNSYVQDSDGVVIKKVVEKK